MEGGAKHGHVILASMFGTILGLWIFGAVTAAFPVLRPVNVVKGPPTNPAGS